mmetsp:Transcript_66151/g.129659  ORF Transcript_66151/g.129659 Transcript_66151/m.129659 type:complete len:247 (-) Transcript_66151:811-1551(-)
MGPLMQKKLKMSPKPKYKYADLFPTDIAVDSPARRVMPRSLWRHESPQKPLLVTILPPISPGGTVSVSSRKKRGSNLLLSSARVLIVACLCLLVILNKIMNSSNPTTLLQAIASGGNVELAAGLQMEVEAAEATRALGNDSISLVVDNASHVSATRNTTANTAASNVMAGATTTSDTLLSPLLISAGVVVAAGEAGEADTIKTINSSDSDKGEVGVHLRGSGKRGAPKTESPPSSANKEEEEEEED